jgi:hypothetical protein
MQNPLCRSKSYFLGGNLAKSWPKNETLLLETGNKQTKKRKKEKATLALTLEYQCHSGNFFEHIRKSSSTFNTDLDLFIEN